MPNIWGYHSAGYEFYHLGYKALYSFYPYSYYLIINLLFNYLHVFSKIHGIRNQVIKRGLGIFSVKKKNIRNIYKNM
jgi:hypothetical protein